MLISINHVSAENASPTESGDINLASAHGTTEKSIVVYIHKSSNNYTVNKLEVIEGQSDYQYDYKIYKGTDYDGGVISFYGKSLGYFSANQMILVQCFDSFDPAAKDMGGCKELPEGDIQLRIPYFSNGKYADIYSPEGKKILTIDLSSKATCNENGKCDRPIEDSINCPQDCKDNQPIIDTPTVQSTQPPVVMQTFWQKVKPYLVIGITTVVIFVSIFLFLKIRKNKEENRW